MEGLGVNSDSRILLGSSFSMEAILLLHHGGLELEAEGKHFTSSMSMRGRRPFSPFSPSTGEKILNSLPVPTLIIPQLWKEEEKKYYKITLETKIPQES